MILSIHHSLYWEIDSFSEIEQTQERLCGNQVLSSYNINTCGVYRNDQLTSYYSPLRKTLKWYQKIVLRFLDLALTNSYLLLAAIQECGDIKTQERLRLQVTCSLLNDIICPVVAAEPSRAFVHHNASDMSTLIGQQLLARCHQLRQKSCPVNTKGIRRVPCHCCEMCLSKPVLCVVPCFDVYHREAKI